jgi:hypothetical protein
MTSKKRVKSYKTFFLYIIDDVQVLPYRYAPALTRNHQSRPNSMQLFTSVIYEL